MVITRMNQAALWSLIPILLESLTHRLRCVQLFTIIFIYSLLSSTQFLTCQVEQQGQEDGMSMNDLLIPLNQQEDLSSYDVFNQNKIFTDNNNYYPQTPYDDDYWNGLLDYNGGNFEDVFGNQELIMRENQSNHRPKRPLTGIIFDDGSSDSDAESISATVNAHNSFSLSIL